jgi:accessory colonization factor AcfC
MTPGSMILVDIYQDATVKPFSYLFINLTQECDYRVKYLSDLFDGGVKVYIQEGKGYKKMAGEGSFKNFILKEISS